MTEEIYYDLVVMTYFFFVLGKSTNCVKRERPNECYFAKEWNFTVDRRLKYVFSFLTLQFSSHFIQIYEYIGRKP